MTNHIMASLKTMLAVAILVTVCGAGNVASAATISFYGYQNDTPGWRSTSVPKIITLSSGGIVNANNYYGADGWLLPSRTPSDTTLPAYIPAAGIAAPSTLFYSSATYAINIDDPTKPIGASVADLSYPDTAIAYQYPAGGAGVEANLYNFTLSGTVPSSFLIGVAYGNLANPAENAYGNASLRASVGDSTTAQITAVANNNLIDWIFFKVDDATAGDMVNLYVTAGANGMASVAIVAFQKPLPQPFIKSASPTGVVTAPAAITVELEDYITQVVPSTVELRVNGQAVAATVSKPAGSAITTVTYASAAHWAPGSTNTFSISFGNNATAPITQTNDFSFVVLDEATAVRIVNIDFNGARNVPAVRGPGPTYIGQGAAGGGSSWNGIVVDSRLEDGTDEDNLTVTGNNLLNSIGGATTIGFTISPVAGDDPSAGIDPTASAALFGDYLFVGDAAQTTGRADFTLSGLGTVPSVDIYFYYGSAGNFTLPGASPSLLTASGIFNRGNTVFFRNVPVTSGSVSGTVGSGSLTILYGMSIQKPLPQPFVKSVSPAGTEVRTNTPINVQLQDYITQVVPSTVQLLVNGQAVAATVSKPSGSQVTTIAYTPPSNWASGAANSFTITFADNAATPLVQTITYGFVALNEALAAATINIDFNGASSIPAPPDDFAPTYEGVGPAGGGRVYNGIFADSRGADGSRIDTLTVGGTNLLNSVGDPTTVSFTISPVTGDSITKSTDPTAAASLLLDYIVVWVDNTLPETVPGVYRGWADFTISGLGSVAYVDLYFYYGHPGMTGTFIPDMNPTPFAGSGIFTPAGTMFYSKVPVTDGVVNGTMRTAGTIVLYGMTIQQALPLPFVKSASPSGLVKAPAGITVELQDNGTQVVPNSVQLRVNGEAVTATVNRPTGSAITTVTYSPAAPWAQGSTNTFSVIYGNNASPPVMQTNDFSFTVLNEAAAATIVNIDFNGASNIPAPPDALAPTYIGPGAAGGWTVFNGIIADSRDPDGVTRTDTLTVGGTNLLNSLGDPTTLSFTISPVTGDSVTGTTDPYSSSALLGDYLAIWIDNTLEETVPGVYRGWADFTIGGLGSASSVDLYFYYGYAGGFFPDISPATFAGSGIYTPANTMFYSNVPVSNGTVTGTMKTATVIVLYGLTVQKRLAQQPGPLSIARQDNSVVVSWAGAGILQSADQVTGPWNDVTGATSPQIIPPTAGQKFYRLRQ